MKIHVSVDAKRYCMKCGEKKPRNEGKEVPDKTGLRYKWVCNACLK